MHGFYFKKDQIHDGKLVINDTDLVHHLKNVLRLTPHEIIDAFDEYSRLYKVQVSFSNETELVFSILKSSENAMTDILSCVLGCAIPKNTKMDDIIDKCAQLGVEKIIPIISERTIVKVDARKAQDKLNRWNRIALMASQQSGRSKPLEVGNISKFADALNLMRNCTCKFIPTLRNHRKPLIELLAQEKQKLNRSYAVLIGPEGDFSDTEVDQACAAGFYAVSLGQTILRVDTAAIAVCGFIKMYENI